MPDVLSFLQCVIGVSLAESADEVRYHALASKCLLDEKGFGGRTGAERTSEPERGRED